ncbi:hypothetical protein KI387_007057, partial [Taxus chinensis]
NLRINNHHRPNTEDYWANCADDFEARRRHYEHYGRLSLQLIKELNLYQIPKGFQDDDIDLLSFEYETLIKHTPLEDMDWYKKEKGNLVVILTAVL